jgi:sterol 3beta-glucosyltransferase
MRITIATFGTRGDVQPFIALALGLQKSGHIVRIAAPERFAAFVTSYGVAFAPLPVDPQELIANITNLRAHPLAALRGMARLGMSKTAPVVRAVAEACADADLIIHFYFLTTIAHSLARARGIPDVAVQLFPFFIPTRAFPMIGAPDIAPGALSYASHWLTTQGFRHGLDTGLRLVRARTPGLFDVPLRWPFDRSARVPTPLLFAYSPLLVPKPADWSAPNLHIAGNFFLDTATTYTPPQELTDFLAAGDAPVCVTFGSMVGRESQRINDVVRATLAQAQQRAVILSGWGGSAADEADKRFFSLDAAPHDWLFPRCRAVIHHGGAGTAAAALRAGMPQVIVPHALDQMFWGRRVAAAAGGPPPIDLRTLSVESLSAALTQATAPLSRASAAEAGSLIRAEDGVATAVRLIEEHAAACARGAG